MTRVPHGGDLGFRVERPDGKCADPVPAPRGPPAAGHRDVDLYGPPDVPGDRHAALVVRRPTRLARGARLHDDPAAGSCGALGPRGAAASPVREPDLRRWLPGMGEH